MESEPYLSVVMPCWNEVGATRQAVDHLFRNTGVPMELLIIDNGSTDETPGYLRDLEAARQEVRVVRNRQNTGFPWAVNQGLVRARGDRILIMNNDVLVPPGWLAPLLSALQHPGVGVVGPVTNKISGPQQIRVPYGEDLAAMESFAQTLARERAGQGYLAIRAVGFFLLIRREVMEAVGGFDVTFGQGNFEDDDFCARVQLAGFRIRIAQDAFVHHMGSRTFRGQNVRYQSLMERNFGILKAKWSLPADWRLEDGIPYGIMLARPADPAFWRCPLSPEEVAGAAKEPLDLPPQPSYRILVWPDWKDPRDSWASSVLYLLLGAPAGLRATLLLRMDPLMDKDMGKIRDRVHRVARVVAHRSRKRHRVWPLATRLNPMDRGRVYRSADAYLDLAPDGPFHFARAEAVACGLPVLTYDKGLHPGEPPPMRR